MSIERLTLSYPDFVLNTVIEPDQIDTNNLEIVTKVNMNIDQENINTDKLALQDLTIATLISDLNQDIVDITTLVNAGISANTTSINDKIATVTALVNAGISANSASIDAKIAVITTSVNNAISIANGAVTTANSASSKADGAIVTANSADAKATSAVSTANSASGTATSANATAISANATANAVQTDYNIVKPALLQAVVDVTNKVDKSYVDAMGASFVLGHVSDKSIITPMLSDDVVANMSIGKIVVAPTAPVGIVADRMWLDTSENNYQETVFDAVNSGLLALNNLPTATGTGTAIIVTMPTLVNGYTKTFILSASNSNGATTINGKPLYRPNSVVSPNLTSGKAITVWYNSIGDCFFIKASAEGNVTVAGVLAGSTFSNDNDSGLVGTAQLMDDTDRLALIDLANIGDAYQIPTITGFISTLGSPTVTGDNWTKIQSDLSAQKTSLVSKLTALGQTAVDTESLQALVNKVVVDPNLTASNVRYGTVINGITGDLYPIDKVAGSLTMVGRVEAQGVGSDNTQYVKVKEILMNFTGSVRVNFNLYKSTTSGTIYAQVYKNGVAVGSVFSNTSSIALPCAYDVTIVSGDLIQIYAKAYTAVYTANIQSLTFTIGNAPSLSALTTTVL